MGSIEIFLLNKNYIQKLLRLYLKRKYFKNNFSSHRYFAIFVQQLFDMDKDRTLYDFILLTLSNETVAEKLPDPNGNVPKNC